MIRIIKRSQQHWNNFAVIVSKGSKSIEIQVDLGIKPGQTNAGVNIPATGFMSPALMEEFISGLSLAQRLIDGKLTVIEERGEEDQYDFSKPQR